MEHVLSLRYSGGRLDEGMDAFFVASSIAGFASFSREIDQYLYGNTPELSLRVRSAYPGSFAIEFLQTAAATSAPLIGHAQDLLELIRESLEILKHLSGSPPISEKRASSGGVIVENNHGSVITCNANTLNLVLHGNLGNNAERFIRRPLLREAEQVEVRVDDQIAGSIDRTDSDKFVPIEETEKLLEHIFEVYLKIVTVVLEGDAQWVFSDGKIRIRAPIEDQSFLREIESGIERFGKGDMLRVRLRSVQERVKGGLKTRYYVEEVLSHERAPSTSGRLI